MYTKHPNTKEKILLPGLKLIGAKNKTRGLLYEYFPSPGSYERYIEPFMGTAGVLIGKPKDSIEEVGDLNLYAINYYKVLQTHPEEFFTKLLQEWEVLKSLGKPYFNQMKLSVTRTKDLVEQAVYFYLITKHCMNGIWRLNKNRECNSSYCGTTQGRGIFKIDHFNAVVERIEKVNFHYSDYRVLLNHANYVPQISLVNKAKGVEYIKAEETFVFLDPPYLLRSPEVPDGCVTTYNACKFLLSNHQELFLFLQKANYKWMLTINDCQYIRDLYKDYNMFSFDVFYSCSQTPGGRGKKNELIIANYDPSPTTYNLIKV